MSFKFGRGSKSTCSKINQGTIWAQNGHTRFLSDFYVPKIRKVVKLFTSQKPPKPLISLQ
jgi:hypothetical protein